MAPGDTLSGFSTGSSTTVPGNGSADYFRVQAAPAPLGIYEHRLVNVSGTAHGATLRGLNQSAGVIGTLDTTVQTNAATPQRFCQWYGFGRAESLNVRITGAATTATPYVWALQSQPIAPLVLGEFQAGQILMNWETQGHATDTDIWVYNAQFHAIVGYGNDDNSVVGGGTGATLQSRLRRPYLPGRYYIALTNFNLANNLGSPEDDDFRNGAVLDFADSVANSSTVANLNLTFTISDSAGASAQIPVQKLAPFEVLWFCFDVGGAKPLGACCIDGHCQVVSECRCAELGGVYAGDGTICELTNCPPNDDCNSAIFVPVPGSATGSTRLARPDPQAFTCGTTVTARGVWYGVVGTGNTIRVSTCTGGTNYDSKLNVYCGPCGSLTCITGNDNDGTCGFGAQNSTVTFCSRLGSVYYILVQGAGGAIGEFQLAVSDDGVPCAPPPGCPPCTIACAGTPEGELCGQNLNGGCNSMPPAFRPIACGETVCGSAFANGGTRDTDWYEFSVNGTQGVTWEVRAEFPVVAMLLRINSCAPIDVDVLAVTTGPPCQPVLAQAVLNTGTYIAFVAPGLPTGGLFDGFPCGFNNDYQATLSCELSPTACEPLAPPLFTIDIPSLVGPLGLLRASDVLTIPGPTVLIPGQNLGLVNDCDALDAISFDNVGTGPGDLFVLRFSVDRASAGDVPPDPTLVGIGLPYNVQEQAAKNQAAADEYVSLLLYTRAGPIFPLNSVSPNNTKTRNQSDAGGVDYFLDPELSPEQTNPSSAESNVEGSAKEPGAPLGPPTYIFYSVTANSPSLAVLPGTVSGADIYIDTNTNIGGTEQLYVAPAVLGLVQADDIDALTVFDDGDHIFESNIDEVQFSLAPGSPTLQLLGRSPADLFRSRGAGMFNVYTLASDLGLSAADNVDAIEYSFCTDVIECVRRWGIGFVNCGAGGCESARGDANCDGVIDFFDIDPFLLALFDPVTYAAVYCGGSICRADANCDGNVDFFDIDPLLLCLFSACPPCP